MNNTTKYIDFPNNFISSNFDLKKFKIIINANK